MGKEEEGRWKSKVLNIYHHFGSELPGSHGRKGNKHKALVSPVIHQMLFDVCHELDTGPF